MSSANFGRPVQFVKISGDVNMPLVLDTYVLTIPLESGGMIREIYIPDKIAVSGVTGFNVETLYRTTEPWIADFGFSGPIEIIGRGGSNLGTEYSKYTRGVLATQFKGNIVIRTSASADYFGGFRLRQYFYQ